MQLPPPAPPAGYDGRHHSREFARIAAAVFAGQGARVHLFSQLVPTPFVATAVRLLVGPGGGQCRAGRAGWGGVRRLAGA